MADQGAQVEADLEATLAMSPLFQGLSSQQVGRVVARGRRVSCKKGQTVLREGDRGDVMYILVAGRVQVSRTVTLSLSRSSIGEAEKSFVELDALNHPAFGEMALLDENSLRGATVTALTDVVLMGLSQGDFDELCEEDPLLGYRVMRNMATQLSARLHHTNVDVLKLSSALSLALNRR